MIANDSGDYSIAAEDGKRSLPGYSIVLAVSEARGLPQYTYNNRPVQHYGSGCETARQESFHAPSPVKLPAGIAAAHFQQRRGSRRHKLNQQH